MRQFTKNDPRINRSGRPKGSPNKNTDEIRTMLQNFVSDNIERLQADFDELETKDRLHFFERLFKYILPAPLNELERLTDEQLDDIINRLKNKSNEN